MKDENEKNYFSRRAFVFTTLAAVSGIFFLKNKNIFINNSSAGILIQPFQNRKKDQANGICLYDMATETAQNYPLPFNVHLFDANPLRPDFLIGANKYGKNFLTFDLNKKEVIKTYKIEDPYVLSGHFTYSNDGKYLCATAFDYQNAVQNCILLFDQNTLTIKKAFHLSNSTPMVHDCRFLPGSHKIVTTAGQSLFTIDCDDGSVSETTIAVPDSRQQLRHLAISKNNDIIVQANVIKIEKDNWIYENGALVQTNLSNEATIYKLNDFEPKALDCEILDLAIDAKNDIFAVVHGKSPFVTFWNMKKKTFLKELELNYASRVVVTKDNNYFLIITQDKLVYVSTTNLEITRTVAPKGFPFGPKFDLPHRTLV